MDGGGGFVEPPDGEGLEDDVVDIADTEQEPETSADENAEPLAKTSYKVSLS